ncbi:TonB-dependent receptor [Fusobacterium perfoetens]|uniref:TonB-dependent receptor n=1 Tax=Fusobacterium perfoetens TaxID=852 RepID=UPI001F274A86|nr:TonB-dependent receptor [Fusobacterium perfoetens]MCF2626373.1 TonB-dependent receptor [Fusobacterium perfoetens]
MKKIIIMSFIASANLYAVSEIQLDKTVVSSTAGFEKPIIEENKNVVLITEEQIKKKQYSDVESILKDTPNVVIQETEFGPVVNLRGSGERSMSRVKTMVDGIAITPLEEAMGTLPINSIPVNSIERIEIIPGGGAVLYGSGTTGGVVNIITKSNIRENFVNADMKYGSYGTRDTGFAIGQMIDKDFYVNFAGQYVNKNGYRDNEELESKSFNGGFDYKINEKHRVKFQASHYDDNSTSSTAVEKSLLEHNRKLAGENISADSERKSFALDYEYKAKDNLTFYANAFKTKYERNFIQDDTMSKEQTAEMIKGNMPSSSAMINSIKIDKDVKGSMTGKFVEETEGVKLKSKYEYNRGTLIFGYDYTAANLKRDSLVSTEEFTGKVMGQNFKATFKTDTFVDMDKDTHAVYALNDYKLTDRLNLTTGLRYEYSKYDGNRLTNTKPNITIIRDNQQQIPMSIEVAPKTSEVDEETNNFAGEIGLTYKYSDTGSVYSRYERGFISPLPTQLTNKINNGKTTEYQSSNLDSETIDSIEFGVRDFIGNSYVSATVFASQTNDEIATLDRNADNPATKLWRFVNIGKTRRVGAELYSEQYFDKLTLNQSVSYVNAEITKVGSVNKDAGETYLEKGDKVPMVSDWKITLGADYKLTDKLSVGAGYTYNSGYERRELAESGKVPKTTKISGYGVADAYIQYSVNDNFILKGGVNNLFNEEYNYYETSSTSIPAPERNYYIAGSIVL